MGKDAVTSGGGRRLNRRAFISGGVGAALVPSFLEVPSAGATGPAAPGPLPPLPVPSSLDVPPAGATGHAAPVLPQPAPVYARHADPADLGVLEAASLLRAGLLSSRELTAACQSRIEKRNGPVTFDGSPTAINAWIRLYPDFAAQLAAAADAKLARARRRRRSVPYLCGIPLGLKDLYAVKGLPVTASSQVLAGNTATGDSDAWARLQAAGMVLLGHTHSDEFAFLAVTPQCGNPWNPSLITGGSSGGSGAALAARMVPAAMGSDTLGSLRIPAAFCGVSSIKPTFGLVSAYGVIPLAWALDHCGPMARTVGDCSLLLSALAGPAAGDPSTDVGTKPPAHYPTLPRRKRRPLAGSRIGVPTNLGAPDAGPAEILSRTLGELRSLGATLVELAVPPDPFGTIGPIEFYTDALSYHRQWYPARGTSYKLPAAQMLSLIEARNLTALEYLSLHRQRAAFQAEWKATFANNRLDAVATLVSLADPPPRSDPTILSPVTNPENSKLLTFIFSYLGFPVVTLPGGTSSTTHLPVGIQLGGAPFSEATLIQTAVDLQAHFPHYEESPAFA
jgi:aspartyl-tRNA(Asn)/glutamyl-tRNA(Gln) amidotransferase subunit A